MEHAAFALRTLALVMLLAPPPALAVQPSQPDPLTLAFATCTGRMAAARHHGWQAAGQRLSPDAAHDAFADMLDAIGPTGADRSPAAIALRAARIQARARTDRLLVIARHGRDPRRQRIAAATLGRELRACETMLP